MKCFAHPHETGGAGSLMIYCSGHLHSQSQINKVNAKPYVLYVQRILIAKVLICVVQCWISPINSGTLALEG